MRKKIAIINHCHNCSPKISSAWTAAWHSHWAKKLQLITELKISNTFNLLENNSKGQRAGTMSVLPAWPGLESRVGECLPCSSVAQQVINSSWCCGQQAVANPDLHSSCSEVKESPEKASAACDEVDLTSTRECQGGLCFTEYAYQKNISTRGGMFACCCVPEGCWSFYSPWEDFKRLVDVC